VTAVTRHPASGSLDALSAGAFPARAGGLQPGDFVLVRSHARLAPRLIGLGQRLHHPPEFAYWTHAALYVGNARVGPPWAESLIEAKGGEPVRYVPLSQYDARDYAAVRLGGGPYMSDDPGYFVEDEMRHNAVAYAVSRLGAGYGYLTIATLSAWALFGGRVTVGIAGENVCSGLVASALTRMGELFDGDPVTQMPADLAEKYGARR